MKPTPYKVETYRVVIPSKRGVASVGALRGVAERRMAPEMADPFDLMEDHATLVSSVVIAYNKVQWLVRRFVVAFSGMPSEQAQDAFFTLKCDEPSVTGRWPQA